ncbi:biotin--[acetyl-CoA-carboxylase] ligase [Deinococcus peraridilitoris]|uniref:biotin--[biotin carboxyl-carrier protein] ligase n=1 Tax=Deinococcus peraridilitoris (strain DSM 19664 / LMG 22246 / CIP 109416 / KR-200) TaxID=937777 RepID=L0A2L5_DEIPD|nr:biotin--[acetyl-CoA-carboxylase] ligase [Deinococcus peraridilitoris]AFZ67255.1 birA, biotin-(acetyl-CoA-carboxylase) ligase [Deinococcus peraridilitoris DSM 19664]
MPERLLNLLTFLPQSGEALARQLGVGRVTVHNRAQMLLAQGFPVEVARAGYALASGTPTPGELRPRGTFGGAYRYLGTVGSTQDEMRSWSDAPHGAVVLAERQTGGRGRRGRIWHSRGGALTFSLLLTDGRSLADLALLPLAAGVALQDACGVGGVKWPNDLLAPDGRKLAGVLLEADVRGEEVRRAVLGIGLNVQEAPPGAAALSELRPARRVDVLRDLLDSLERWLTAPPAEVLSAWRARNVTLGREVRVTTLQGEVHGVARDLDDDGALLLDTAGGSARIASGDVELVSTRSAP